MLLRMSQCRSRLVILWSELEISSWVGIQDQGCLNFGENWTHQMSSGSLHSNPNSSSSGLGGITITPIVGQGGDEVSAWGWVFQGMGSKAFQSARACFVA